MNKSLLAAPVGGGGVSVYDLDVTIDYSALDLSGELVKVGIWVFEDPQQPTAMLVQGVLKNIFSSITVNFKENGLQTTTDVLPEKMITLAQQNTDDTKGFIALWPLARPDTGRAIGSYDYSVISNTDYEPICTADVMDTFILVCLPTEMFADKNLESLTFTLSEIP